MKILGAEFVEFLNSFPETFWDAFAWESQLEESELQPANRYDLDELGTIEYQVSIPEDDELPCWFDVFGKRFRVRQELSILELLRAWRKSREVKTLLVEVPLEKLVAVTAYLKAAKCSVRA